MWAGRNVSIMALAVCAALASLSGVQPPAEPVTSGTTSPAAEDWILDDDEFEPVDLGIGAVDATWTAADQPRAPAQGTGRPAPRVGAPGNPFANTCDGRVVGFIGPTGEAPRMEFSGAPAGAIFECRTGPAASVAHQPFRACDGESGTRPSHVLPLTAEGTYRTEVRYSAAGQPSDVAVVAYYVHHSLDRVSCCSLPVSDGDLFAAARTALPAGDAFEDPHLENPFVEIPRSGLATPLGPATATRIMSLRRTFRLSDDRRLLLIRRTMASRRARERTGRDSCVGIRLAAPVRSSRAAKPLTCGNSFPRQSPFHDGLVDSRCPDIYCTVSTCTVDQDGCRRITHTFSRGPNQAPWVVTKTACPDPVLTSFTPLACDAYVLNAKGQAACLEIANGRARVAKAFTDGAGTGLRILGPQRHAKPERGQPGATDQYVFSAKSRTSGIKGALFLPR